MAYLKDRKAAFYFAFTGLVKSVKKETHMKIHLGCALAVIVGGFALGLSKHEWVLVILCISLVMMAEILNTAIEKICDMVSQEIRPDIKYIKDISAGAVLLACIAAFITGVLIFYPHMKAFFD